MSAAIDVGPDGAAVVVPPKLVTATGLALNRVVTRALERGSTVDLAVRELLLVFREADALNAAGVAQAKAPPSPDRILTVTGVARGLGRSPQWVRQLAARGDLPGSSKSGRDWLIPESAVEAYRRKQRCR